MKEVIKKRSNTFAHQCVKLALELPKNKLGSHIEGQLIRSSTSVAANFRAAFLGRSKRAFISKLGIVIEEADECIFWLEFMRDEGLGTRKFSSSPPGGQGAYFNFHRHKNHRLEEHER